MDAYRPKAWKLGQAEFPRQVLMRVSSEQARKESDAELKRLAFFRPNLRTRLKLSSPSTLLLSKLHRLRRPGPTISRA